MRKFTLLFHEDCNWKSIVRTTSTIRKLLKKDREVVVGRKLYGSEYFSDDIDYVITAAFKSDHIPIFVIDTTEEDEIMLEERRNIILYILRRVYNPHFLTINVMDPDEFGRLRESGKWTGDDVVSYIESVADYILNITLDYEIDYEWEELYLTNEGEPLDRFLCKSQQALFKFFDSESFDKL